MFHVWGRILGFTIFLSSFFLKLSSKNRSSLLGSEPIALAILAAGPSNLSESFTELELLFRDSLSFFALTLETDPGGVSVKLVTMPPNIFNFILGIPGWLAGLSCGGAG